MTSQLVPRIDPTLKPVFDRKQGGGDYYVTFCNFAKERWTHPLEGEGGADVFVMSNALFDIENAKQELAAVSETVREQVIQARIGQGVFRHKLLAHWEGMCAVTGIAVPQTLVASHIKPWRASSNADRLDQFNGLLLVGTLDRLFDSGLVSFSDSGGMLVSEQLHEANRRTLGLNADLQLRSVHAKHRPFLREHRTLYGFDG